MPVEVINKKDDPIDISIQDQSTPTVIAKFNKVITSTTLTEDAEINTNIIVVTSATSIVVGTYIILFDITGVRYGFYTATVVNGTTITLDTPLDYDYPAGTNVDVTVTNLNVDGSVTPQTFGLRGLGVAPGVSITVDVTRLIFHATTDTAVDLTKFADIAALTKGLVCRRRNGTIYNIFNVKTNGELAGIMYDFTVEQAINPQQGQDGFTARLTFAGQNKMGVVIRLPLGDDLELIVQDDLTGIALLEVVAEGHILEE